MRWIERWCQLVWPTRLTGVLHEVWDLNSAHISTGRGLVYIYVIFKIKTVDINVMNKKLMPVRFLKLTLSPCLVGKEETERRAGERKWEQKRVYFNSIVWLHFFKPNMAQVLIFSLPFLQLSKGVVQSQEVSFVIWNCGSQWGRWHKW